jgi:hypothetical protein
VKGEGALQEDAAMIGRMLAAAGVVAVMAGGAQAAQVDRREGRQAARLAQNVHDGDLTWRETARLSAEQARIHREELRYRLDDGRLDACERRELQREQDQASRHIYRQAHDAQRR